MKSIINKNPEISTRRWGNSWLLLCGALGLHVIDEALNDFLSFYNPTVEKITETLSFLPLPTFTFNMWISLLITAIMLLILLSKFAYSGKTWMRPLSYIFSVIMIANGLIHLGGSLVTGEILPGSYSSPILIACAFYLFWCTPGFSEDTPVE